MSIEKVLFTSISGVVSPHIRLQNTASYGSIWGPPMHKVKHSTKEYNKTCHRTQIRERKRETAGERDRGGEGEKLSKQMRDRETLVNLSESIPVNSGRM